MSANSKKRDEPEQFTHPSYGMLAFSRVHNSTKRGEPLFGSALETHYGTVRLSIERGKWEHSLHEDRYYSTSDPQLIEVEMSSAQFVEAITTMNSMPGVPCTIRALNGRPVESPPRVATEVERVRTTFEAELRGMINVMKERRVDIEKLTSGLSAKAKERLRIELDVMIQQLESNVPFVLSQFEEASERVVTAAKHEIEQFAQHRIREAGLAALAGTMLPALPAGKPCGECDACHNNQPCIDPR